MKKKLVVFLTAIMLTFGIAFTTTGCATSEANGITVDGAYAYNVGGDSYMILHLYKDSTGYVIYKNDEGEIDSSAKKFEYKVLKENEYLVLTYANGDSTAMTYELLDNGNLLILDSRTFKKQ